MRLALHQPDIAGNVGTLLRRGACLGVGVDLIEPMGFAWGDRALARAGMDYAAASITRHAAWAASFTQSPAGPSGSARIAASSGAGQPGATVASGAASAGVSSRRNRRRHGSRVAPRASNAADLRRSAP